MSHNNNRNNDVQFLIDTTLGAITDATRLQHDHIDHILDALLQKDVLRATDRKKAQTLLHTTLQTSLRQRLQATIAFTNLITTNLHRRMRAVCERARAHKHCITTELSRTLLVQEKEQG